MAPYDSDSSGDEDTEYSKTNVVLGFAAKESAEQVDTISHIGGRPDWIDPATPPSAKLARCKVCNDMLVLLLQLNGDLPEVFPGHERRIYVLGCRRKTCRRKEGSVRAIRGLRNTQTIKEKKTPPEDENTKPKAVAHIGESLFGAKPSAGTTITGSINPFGNSNSNPFSTSSSATTAGPSNPFAAAGLSSPSTISAISPQVTDIPKSFAAALSLNNTQPSPPKFGPPPPPEPWPQESSLPPAYPSYYLEDDMEWLDKLPVAEIPTQMMDLDDSTSSSGGGKEDKEVYESTIDKTFQKFADRLEQNPEQVIRYEFKGHPLLYSKSDAVGRLFAGEREGKVKVENGSGGKIPRCANCGAGRVFEVQLTPHAIMELEREEGGLDGMEWGTVIVGVCERDCNEKGVEGKGAGYVEEWIGVQWEELRR